MRAASPVLRDPASGVWMLFDYDAEGPNCDAQGGRFSKLSLVTHKSEERG